MLSTLFETRAGALRICLDSPKVHSHLRKGNVNRLSEMSSHLLHLGALPGDEQAMALSRDLGAIANETLEHCDDGVRGIFRAIRCCREGGGYASRGRFWRSSPQESQRPHRGCRRLCRLWLEKRSSVQDCGDP